MSVKFVFCCLILILSRDANVIARSLSFADKKPFEIGSEDYHAVVMPINKINNLLPSVNMVSSKSNIAVGEQDPFENSNTHASNMQFSVQMQNHTAELINTVPHVKNFLTPIVLTAIQKNSLKTENNVFTLKRSKPTSKELVANLVGIDEYSEDPFQSINVNLKAPVN